MRLMNLRVISAFLILLLLGNILVGCTPKSMDKPIEVGPYDGYKVSEENKLLGEIIISLLPEKEIELHKPIVSNEQPNWDLIMTTLRLNESNLESYAIMSKPLENKIETIAVLKPHIMQEQYVFYSINDWLLSIQSQLEFYDEKQVELYESLIIDQVGDYIVIVIQENPQEVFENLVKGIVSMWEEQTID